MRVTVTIDDELYEKALQLTDPSIDKANIFTEAIKFSIRTQCAKRLAALGGTMPEIKNVRRRKFRG